MPVSKKDVSPCPIDSMLSVIDGRWKGTILWRLIGRIGWIESGGGGEPDCRSYFSETGDGVVEQIPIAQVDDVGSQ
jgi:hypothetical protein